MKNGIFIGLFAAVLSLVSCVREAPETGIGKDGQRIVITLGWEDQLPATKTYLSGGSKIRWSTNSRDKRIYVFDSKGGKSTFTSDASAIEDVRTFTGSITSGSEVKYILWHGSDTDDVVLTDTSSGAGTETISAGGSATLETKADLMPPVTAFTGSCLTLASVQKISNGHSFAADSNISVMKEGDTCLKSVFGYLRYRIPAMAVGGKHAAIKSVTVQADEEMAGQVIIDYNGNEPVASIVSGTNAITVNTRWKDNYYEEGLYLIVIPAGTYHNMSIIITPFAEASDTQSAAAGEPFTIYCRGEVVVERGKYTDLGTLPVAKPASTNPGFKFDSDYFEAFTDPQSGVVSYRIKSDALGWDNSQSGYYVTKGMTDDERFIYFMVSANEFRPSYHTLAQEEESAKILDLQTRKLYTFQASNACYPYLDPVEDKIYYVIKNEEKNAAKFYMRDLKNAPDVEVPLADFPQKLVPVGATRPIRRVCSHITLTQDKRKVFLDAWVVDTFYQGLLDLYTGEWTEWSHNVNECHLTHAALNPTRDDEVLLAMDSWTDTQKVEHKMSDVGYANDGEFNGQGTYMRMWIMKPDGSRSLVRPGSNNYASHEGWHPDGNYVYWCGGDGSFHIRSLRNPSDYQTATVEKAAHCCFSEDKNYVVHDDNRDWGSYSGNYRGCQWRVWFTNRATGKHVAIYSGLKPIATAAEPSRIHPDPHPHFVAGDKYVVCTAAGDDGNIHWSITPVDQLITLTQ